MVQELRDLQVTNKKIILKKVQFSLKIPILDPVVPMHGSLNATRRTSGSRESIILNETTILTNVYVSNSDPTETNKASIDLVTLSEIRSPTSKNKTKNADQVGFSLDPKSNDTHSGATNSRNSNSRFGALSQESRNI